MIPRNTRFIDGSAFIGVQLASISIEPGNATFVLEKNLLINIIHHKLIRSFADSSHVDIPGHIRTLGASCFSMCRTLSSLSFQSNSHLIRIEPSAFALSSLQSIVVPRNTRFIDGSAFIGVTLSSISIEPGNETFIVENDFLIDNARHRLIRNFSQFTSVEIPCHVEILGSFSFSYCIAHLSVSSIAFTIPSQLRRIESQAFSGLSVAVAIPPTIMFIAYDAAPDYSAISLVDANSCPEFDRWRKVRKHGVTVDFRRILRCGSRLPSLKAYRMDLSGFKEKSPIGRSDRSWSQLYRRRTDGSLIVVKSIRLSARVEQFQIESEIENLLNLRHPLIATPVGFVLPTAQAVSRELKVARLYAAGGSLAEALRASPLWWTPTMKSKTVVGIVLALRFAHSFGLIHGGLKPSNVLFDINHRVIVADFAPIRLQAGETEREARSRVGGFSGHDWTTRTDVWAFASLLFEIVVGRRAAHPGTARFEVFIPPTVPEFVAKIITRGLAIETKLTFNDIFDLLKRNEFRIMEGVDSEDVSVFVSLVEPCEQSEQQPTRV
jgi:serine/threonine protein kinase